MRTAVLMAAFLALGSSFQPVCASSPDDNKSTDQQAIDALEARASQAEPREQCFLYAQLVHQMTELSVKQYAAGNTEAAGTLLKRIQTFTKKIHFSLANNDKRLKNAEILLNHTAFRLNEMLHSTDFEDRPLVQQTLVQVNQAQSEAMLQVFHK
jgi:hypothetical protein